MRREKRTEGLNLLSFGVENGVGVFIDVNDALRKASVGA
jgi:hypothetical protein